jgi:hypothetical protein
MAIITHIWTVIIVFTESGFFGGILTLFVPFLGEIYWMFKMFGENDTYAYIVLIHLFYQILFLYSDVEIDRKTTHNSTYPKVAIQWLNQAPRFYQSLCLVDSELLRNRHL